MGTESGSKSNSAFLEKCLFRGVPAVALSWTRSAAAGAIIIAVVLAACDKPPAAGDDPRADPQDAVKVALGREVYTQYCAACHGARLEGQADWRRRRSNGRLPAPPHDDSGHTWHHGDNVLFGITQKGLVPPYAPKGYASDMPAFGETLSDEEIWAVLAYIKSHWTAAIVPARIQHLSNARKQ